MYAEYASSAFVVAMRFYYGISCIAIVTVTILKCVLMRFNKTLDLEGLAKAVLAVNLGLPGCGGRETVWMCLMRRSERQFGILYVSMHARD